jgi:single-stranded DNA-specific DHH superfamily exonuclease
MELRRGETDRYHLGDIADMLVKGGLGKSGGHEGAASIQFPPENYDEILKRLKDLAGKEGS